MKYILITLLALLHVGCADKNAFDKFNMQKDQELSTDSLQSSKIKKGLLIDGVVSAIYLNNIYPDIYNEYEYFYIYLYQKKKEDMYNPDTLDEIKLTMRLNKTLPTKVKKLSHENRFSHLTSTKSRWQRYFLISFEKIKGENLSLVLESGQSSSGALTFQKAQQ